MNQHDTVKNWQSKLRNLLNVINLTDTWDDF